MARAVDGPQPVAVITLPDIDVELVTRLSRHWLTIVELKDGSFTIKLYDYELG